MAPSNIGPYVLKLHYHDSVFQHVMAVNLLVSPDPTPGDAFTAINCPCHDTTSRTLDVVTDALVAAFKGLLSAATGVIDRAELWKWTGSGFDLTFVSSYTIAVAGTGALPELPTSQLIMTFRSTGGGIYKFALMGGIVPPGPTVPPGSFTGSYTAVADYLTGLAHSFIARDDGRPFAALGAYPGQNEALFKAFYRP